MRPCLLSAENWKITGRWNTTSEMYKLRDRKKSEFLLGPTHEEEVTSLVSSLVSSFKSLPLRVYQIGKKYRDELRPRGGLLRAKEFVMKDMYSFDTSASKALETSHEYHIISPIGEDTILKCSNCTYTANVEKAVGTPSVKPGNIKIPSWINLKSELPPIDIESEGVLYRSTSSNGFKYSLVLIPKGRTINSVKLEKNLSLENPQVLLEYDNKVECDIYIDSSLGLFEGYRSIDLVEIKEGDGCSSCKNGILGTERAIEVGHTFYLGTKYSSSLKATFKDTTQKNVLFEMGCYGIGVSRLVSAIIEASHDRHGMIWPTPIAPYKVCVVPVYDKCNREMNKDMEKILSQLVYNMNPHSIHDVALDDRDVSFGFKMKDAQLMGYPYVIVAGQAFLEKGVLEIHERKGGNIREVSDIDELHSFFKNL
ncbi:hypothetical protein HK103_004772 [Boothiomyces macroporosus]|uniref:proline--tRNA ligase n=1 Tax=Boothiomyces macroporosus TaxID=261099 RepID=A0AAD5URS3_9FUNG|nr:hypothetical protein HK103_004772 [Boothiomyces macroporosus]